MREEKIEIQKNISLKKYTTFGIGGSAKYFFEAKNEKAVVEAINWAKTKSLPFFVLAGGSNLLAADKGFDGLVIKMKNEKMKIKNDNEKLKEQDYKPMFDTLEAGAGVALRDLISFCLENGLSGLEWASGIPKATIGGAVFMNAGAFGQNIADLVEKVEAFDAASGQLKTFLFPECSFGYKDSIFKRNKNLVIFVVVLQLEKKAPKDIIQEMKRVLEYRKTHHPFLPSAGSVFKNAYNMSAGEIVERCGLKGKKIGKAQISEQHANFIVNLGGASSADVKALIDLTKNQAKEKFNITLEEEIQYLQ